MSEKIKDLLRQRTELQDILAELEAGEPTVEDLERDINALVEQIHEHRALRAAKANS